MGICSARKSKNTEQPNSQQQQQKQSGEKQEPNQQYPNPAQQTPNPHQTTIRAQDNSQNTIGVQGNLENNQVHHNKVEIGEIDQQYQPKSVSANPPYEKQPTEIVHNSNQAQITEEGEIEQRLQQFQNQFTLLSDMLKQMTDEFQKLSREFQENTRQELQ